MLTREIMERELKILTELAGIPLVEAIDIINRAAAQGGVKILRSPSTHNYPGRRDDGARALSFRGNR